MKIRKTIQFTPFILFYFLSICMSAQGNGEADVSLLQNIDSRIKVSLDGPWKIIVDPLENGYYNHRWLPKEDGYFKNKKMQSPSDLIEYDFDSSYELNVPGDWNTQMEKLYFYEGTVWYKKSFNYTKQDENNVFVYFEAINYEAKVYLNGDYIGEHIGGYTPFQFDVTDKLKAEGNFLVLKVNNTRKREAIPTINTDWWNYGGIIRSVHLISTPKSHIADYFLQLSPNNKSIIKGWVDLSGNASGEEVNVRIPELNQNVFARVNDQGRAFFEIEANPSLWSPESPKLYDVLISTDSDDITDQIGFRTIETRGYDILLNGKSIFLKGISIHAEAPYKTGRVTTLEECRILLNWAKQLGCNFIRLAHYPHSEMMVKEAEKMGLLVWSEIPVYWTVLFDNADTYSNAQNQLDEMISRDKNRAAVILWGIANETPVSAARNKFLEKLAARVRELDNTRLVTAALDTQSSDDDGQVIDDKLGEVVDVIGINNYCGWYYRDPEYCAGVKWKTKFNKPVVMSEVGAGALHGLHGEPNERWSEEYQEAVYLNNIEMMKNMEFLRGASPWILMDFRSHRRHLNEIQKDFNRKGLISEQGEFKKSFYVLKKYYEQMKMDN